MGFTIPDPLLLCVDEGWINSEPRRREKTRFSGSLSLRAADVPNDHALAHRSSMLL
jgi:hypothetical protein